ncbi:MAG: PD-(D/E)XK nuclease family protein [Verrucomicrobia bacterium]|nr:PD-(D/E)XK nuclease family protein [Verrucomicrobiota bacterium]
MTKAAPSGPLGAKGPMTATIPASFAWSLARHECFHTCLRRYYYRYYAGTGVIQQVRDLQLRHEWAHTHIRRGAHEWLRESLEIEAAAARLLQTLRDDFRASRQHEYRLTPKRTAGLFEHECGIAVPDEEWKSLADRAVADLRTFAGTAYGRELAAGPAAARLAIGENLRFDLRGLAVDIRPDLVLKDGTGLRIHDWIQPSDVPSRGLTRAALVWLAVEHWGAAPAGVVLVEYTFPSGPREEYRFSEEDLEAGRELIHDSADEMRYPLADPERDLAREEDFDVADDERICHTCPFLRLCARWR